MRHSCWPIISSMSFSTYLVVGDEHMETFAPVVARLAGM